MRHARRAASSLGPVALLAGCVGFGGNGDAPREVQVTSDQITITGPRGFCVDPTATQSTIDTAFVILGNCAAISGSAREEQPEAPAVLTAAVASRSGGAGLTENIEALDAFFRSEDGRALLSRASDGSTVQILETRTQAGLFLLHARDTSAGDIVGVSPDYWRAYMEVGPRLATLTVLALEESATSDAQALATLTQFVGAVRRANVTAGAADVPQNINEVLTPPFRQSLFQRIFQ